MNSNKSCDEDGFLSDCLQLDAFRQYEGRRYQRTPISHRNHAGREGLRSHPWDHSPDCAERHRTSRLYLFSRALAIVSLDAASSNPGVRARTSRSTTASVTLLPASSLNLAALTTSPGYTPGVRCDAGVHPVRPSPTKLSAAAEERGERDG